MKSCYVWEIYIPGRFNACTVHLDTFEYRPSHRISRLKFFIICIIIFLSFFPFSLPPSLIHPLFPFGKLAALIGLIRREHWDCFKITALKCINTSSLYDPFGALHTHRIKAPFFTLRFWQDGVMGSNSRNKELVRPNCLAHFTARCAAVICRDRLRGSNCTEQCVLFHRSSTETNYSSFLS